jgi:hypothetical protein
MPTQKTFSQKTNISSTMGYNRSETGLELPWAVLGQARLVKSKECAGPKQQFVEDRTIELLSNFQVSLTTQINITYALADLIKLSQVSTSTGYIHIEQLLAVQTRK